MPPFAEHTRSPGEYIVQRNASKVKLSGKETATGLTYRKLLDLVRDTIRLKHYSTRTEQCYINWIKRYISFHSIRHPYEVSAADVEAFLTHLAVHENVAALPTHSRRPVAADHQW